MQGLFWNMVKNFWHISWLVFCQLDVSWSPQGKLSVLWETDPNRPAWRQVCETFSWLMKILEDPAHCELCRSWVGGFGLYQKVAEPAMGEQTGKYPPAIGSASVLPPGSCFELLPWLSSRMGCDRGSTSQTNPFLPKLLAVRVFCHISGKLEGSMVPEITGDGVEEGQVLLHKVKWVSESRPLLSLFPRKLCNFRLVGLVPRCTNEEAGMLLLTADLKMPPISFSLFFLSFFSPYVAKILYT